MSAAPLNTILCAMLDEHPALSVSAAGHAAHALRYVSRSGLPIALEPERIRFQNLWLRADSVDLAALGDIEHKVFRAASFRVSKPNHDLFGEDGFKGCDLVRFRVTRAEQARRILEAALGGGSA